MIIQSLINALRRPRAAATPTPDMLMPTGGMTNYLSNSGQTVTAETSKNIATAYRCGNVLSDDVAKIPFQLFSKSNGKIEHEKPSALVRNMAYLIEVRPNRWMNPFIFKKSVMLWLLYWGNAYIWLPAGGREMFILPASNTEPVFDESGNLWYETKFSNGETAYIPDVEILHLKINSQDGFIGKSVISYARDTLGRQQAAHQTQDMFYKQGLTAAAVVWFNGDLSPEAREKVRTSYGEAITGSSNAYRLAVFDNKITKLDQITMKPQDMQFLESIEANEADIANFFGMPLFKLNQGKQSYNSNEQANLDYLSTTLDPYFVQWEQAALVSWLPQVDQGNKYFRFNRDALLRTDASTRATVIEKRILSGQLSPNEARQIEDLSSYPGGDQHYMPSNMAVISGSGDLRSASSGGA
jgi:HK97 family phage portal protein